MRFGTFSYNQARPWVPERQAFAELLEQIQLTEKLGFDEAWFAEHHHSDYGMLASPSCRSPHWPCRWPSMGEARGELLG